MRVEKISRPCFFFSYMRDRRKDRNLMFAFESYLHKARLAAVVVVVITDKYLNLMFVHLSSEMFTVILDCSDWQMTFDSICKQNKDSIHLLSFLNAARRWKFSTIRHHWSISLMMLWMEEANEKEREENRWLRAFSFHYWHCSMAMQRKWEYRTWREKSFICLLMRVSPLNGMCVVLFWASEVLTYAPIMNGKRGITELVRARPADV